MRTLYVNVSHKTIAFIVDFVYIIAFNLKIISYAAKMFLFTLSPGLHVVKLLSLVRTLYVNVSHKNIAFIVDFVTNVFFINTY